MNNNLHFRFHLCLVFSIHDDEYCIACLLVQERGVLCCTS